MQAAVPFYGVYDFTRFDDAMNTSMPELLEKVVMKQPHATNFEAYTQASPVNNVSADAPPFFVLHGRNDSLVLVEQARSFVAKLEDISTQPVVYAEFPLAQHAFDMFGSARAAHAALGVAVEQFLAEIYTDRRQTSRSEVSAG
ncbi:hypothetical protein MHOL44478_23815 [Mycobacterium holsaticum DSM 44478]|nr:hypothetical protein [Mycolicibacterium holsaticum DSM 44478 = JCM 12374]